MALIRVGGVQMPVSATAKENLPRITQAVIDINCEFLLFPELALTGPNPDFGEARTEEAWEQIATACRKSYTTALVGTGARLVDHTHIQTRIFAHDGTLVGTQEKLVPTQAERAWCRPGEDLNTFEHEGLLFGCLNGNDCWVAPGHGPYPDPRLTHRLGEQGVRVIFVSADTGTDPDYAAYYDSNLRLRAREANAYIVVANAAPESGELNCPSGVVTPQGEWAAECPRSGAQFFTYAFDPDLD